MRLPDPIYCALERIYFHQRALRRAETLTAVRQNLRDRRASAAALHTRHTAGTCGGATNGCYYVPCVPKVGHV